MNGKLLLVLAVALLASVAAARNHAHKSKLDLSRPAINHKLINKINSNPDSTWTAGVNSRFEGMTLSDVKALLGAKMSDRRVPAPHAHRYPAIRRSAPSSYDIRTTWGTKCPSVKGIRDQSDCGSCWAVAAAGAMTDRYCIAHSGKSNPWLSAADIVACDNTGYSEGCDGGELSDAWDYFENTGVVTGSEFFNTTDYPKRDPGCYMYPFPQCMHHVPATNSTPACSSTEYNTPDCPNKCTSGSAHSHSWSKEKAAYRGKTSYSVTGEDSMISDLVEYGSVELAFTVYEDFLSYKSGVYQYDGSSSELGGHAVKLIGYGKEDGTKYWLIANSWNAGWGDKGTFKIIRGTDDCGIEDGGWAGTV
jgi:cathepsin B